MTDLEITRLCAAAMGGDLALLINWRFDPFKSPQGRDEDGKWHRYNPLHDDAQAMALLKRFRLLCEWQPHLDSWFVAGRGAHIVDPMTTDLNRAICECVAQMQQAK